MNQLNLFDYTLIAGYFAVLVAVGFYFRKMASASLEDYFLGGRKLPWWTLGISGMAA
jgi:solute:Na+ symporter, SSS family